MRVFCEIDLGSGDTVTEKIKVTAYTKLYSSRRKQGLSKYDSVCKSYGERGNTVPGGCCYIPQGSQVSAH